MLNSRAVGIVFGSTHPTKIQLKYCRVGGGVLCRYPPITISPDREKLRGIFTVDLANQSIVVEALHIQFGGLRDRRLLQHDLDRLRIDGHIFVPDFDPFIVTLVDQLLIGYLAALSEHGFGVAGIVESALHSVKISHEKNL